MTDTMLAYFVYLNWTKTYNVDSRLRFHTKVLLSFTLHTRSILKLMSGTRVVLGKS